MLSFEAYSQGVFISSYINVMGDRISLNERIVKQVMENQKIRKTKTNIQICKQGIIDFIKLGLSDNWIVYHECNGDFGFKC